MTPLHCNSGQTRILFGLSPKMWTTLGLILYISISFLPASAMYNLQNNGIKVLKSRRVSGVEECNLTCDNVADQDGLECNWVVIEEKQNLCFYLHCLDIQICKGVSVEDVKALQIGQGLPIKMFLNRVQRTRIINKRLPRITPKNKTKSEVTISASSMITTVPTVTGTATDIITTTVTPAVTNTTTATIATTVTPTVTSTITAAPVVTSTTAATMTTTVTPAVTSTATAAITPTVTQTATATATMLQEVTSTTTTVNVTLTALNTSGALPINAVITTAPTANNSSINVTEPTPMIFTSSTEYTTHLPTSSAKNNLPMSTGQQTTSTIVHQTTMANASTTKLNSNSIASETFPETTTKQMHSLKISTPKSTTKTLMLTVIPTNGSTTQEATTQQKQRDTTKVSSSTPGTMPTSTVAGEASKPPEIKSRTTLAFNDGKNYIFPSVPAGSLIKYLADTTSLITILIFGLLFLLVSILLFAQKAFESYKRKDYVQVDYLINGMYAESDM
ncbi:integumentary mucin C.1-like [Carcharodon carcharias]|uniref:integumentary mucin C.1-like n=1 Tax=Carcharodon carcharias TaxID=13397 RepID=UPI001B7DFB48|nr:integumentary mucin C.1-like [Carcharodon carcharias]